MVVTTGEVFADYSQFELWPGAGGHYVGLDDIGLAIAGEDITLITARQHGLIPVEVQVVDLEPPLDPGWDAVVEMSVHTGEEMRVCGWAAEGAFLPVALPAGTDVRVRYVVVDGQTGAEQSRDSERWDDPAAERYLLQVWPAPPTPGRAVVATSAWSQYWAFGPAARALLAELVDVPDPDRLTVVIDRALAAHPDTAAHLRSGDERFRSGVIRYAQELFRVTYHSGAYDDIQHDHERLRRLIDERVGPRS